MNDYEVEIRRFIADKFLFGDERKLSSDESLMEAGIIDSTGVLELIAYLEERFRIKIDNNELVPENLDSISLICTFLGKKHG